MTEIRGPFEESIVGRMLASVIPDALGRIQFWRVGRKLEDLHVTTVGFEPVIGFLFLVVGRVVLDEIDPVSAAVEGGHDDLLHKGQVGLPLKVVLLMQIDETGVV